MALTEERVTDKIEVVGNPDYRTIQIRHANRVHRDGSEIASSYHRDSIVPGQLVSTPVQVVDSLPTSPEGLTNGELYYQATDAETTFTATTSGGSSFSQLVLGQRGLYLYNLEADAGRAWTQINADTSVESPYDLYRRTDLTNFDQEIQNIAGLCWDNDTHTSYESLLRQQ